MCSQFWKQHVLSPLSNGVFGEGGAGTFSDGKLTTRTSSEYHSYVHDVLIACGAKENIKSDPLCCAPVVVSVPGAWVTSSQPPLFVFFFIVEPRIPEHKDMTTSRYESRAHVGTDQLRKILQVNCIRCF